MNRRVNISILFICIMLLLMSAGPGESFDKTIIDKVKITNGDIPEGFVYGMIPDFARTTLQSNPWMLDRNAINKLTKNIYPSGDSSSIKNMHVSILAKKERPYNDDIVCYIIVYKDKIAGRKEFDKLGDFVKVNSDRTIVLQRENLAVFLIVDDVRNFKYIVELKEKFEQRIEN